VRRTDPKAKAPTKRAKTEARLPEKGGSAPQRKLKPGEQAQRDLRILQRRAQGWTWDAIAHAAGMSEKGARLAAARRSAEAPLTLKTDPVQVVEETILGLQTSIADCEELAVRYQDSHPSAAAGAKKAANGARRTVQVLLQATGRQR